MVRKEVKETFEQCAARYDRLIEKVVPHYHDQHEVMLSFIPFPKQKRIKILDLGIGTGAISRILLKKYPHSTVHGIDLSERMLNICSANLKKYRKRITLTLGEFEKTEFDGYRITCVHYGAVDKMREVKPQIPATGSDGTPISDSVELLKDIGGAAFRSH